MNIKRKSFWSQKKIIKIYNEDRKNLKDLYYAEKIFLKNCLFENCSILDIGCADGSLLDEFKNLGFKNLFGIEPTDTVKIAKKKETQDTSKLF